MCRSKLFYSLAYLCCCCCFFVALVPLLGPGFYFYFTEVSPNRNKAEHWAEQGWFEQECKVLGKGIAYRGNCDDNSVGDECPASDTSWTAGEMNAASVCEAKAISAWVDARRLLGTDTVDEDNVDMSPEFDNTGGRRLGCGHSFLPWVRVNVDGKKRCAYRDGMAVSLHPASSSTTAEGPEDFLTKYVVGTSTSCYTIPTDDCIVALEFRMDYLRHKWAWNVAGWPIGHMIGAGFGCLAAGFLCCLVLCCLPKDLFEDDNESEEFTPMWEVAE